MSPTLRRRIAAAAVLLGFAVQAIVSTSLALRSSGTYQDDELRHYLVARTAQHDWRKLLDVWGRPGFTVPFAPAAGVGDMPGGFRATRLMTVAVMLLASVLTYLTARRMRAPMAWLVPWLLLLMPLWTGLSFTPTTEAVAALYLIGGTWQLAGGHRRWAAVWFAMLPLARHELIVLLVPVALYFLWRRDVRAVLLLGWGELAWNVAAWAAGTKIPLTRFVTPLDQGHLGSGNVLHYFNRWLEMGGVPAVALTLAAAAMLLIRELRHRPRLIAKSRAGRRARLRCFISGGAVALVALQTVLYHFNRFASGGYARFLVPIAPWMAVTILYALWGLVRSRRPRPALLVVALVMVAAWVSGSYVRVPYGWFVAAAVGVVLAVVVPSRLTAAAALLLLFATAAWQWRDDVHPYVMGPHQELVGKTIDDLKRQYPGSRIVGASPWVKYFQNELMGEEEPQARGRWAEDNPPGVMYLYDQSHATAVPYEWFTQFPHELVTERWLATNTTVPYVRVLRRVPPAR